MIVALVVTSLTHHTSLTSTEVVILSDPLKELIDHIQMHAPTIKIADKDVYNRLFQLSNQAREVLNRRVNEGGVIEVLHYPDRKHDPYTEMFYHSAVEQAEDGDLEVDHATMITESDDNGEYVLSYKWVSNDDVVFPPRQDVELGYESDGVYHYLAREAVVTYERDAAEKHMLDKHWDSRLDSAGCTAKFTHHVVRTQAFHAYLQYEENDDEVEHHVEAAAAEDVLHGLKILYGDLSDYHSVYIRDEAGNSLVLRDDQLVADDE